MPNKGTRTRNRIVTTALQLFTVKGYFNTSVSDLLEATGLTKGGLYGHFRSKEEIWYAVYDEAVSIWRGIVFEGVREIHDPLTRIEKLVDNNMTRYLGEEVFDGGCFFFNMLTELSGQSTSMTRHLLKGYVRFSRLMRRWLEEAHTKGLLTGDPDFREVTNFIVVALNGAAPLYSASRDRQVLTQTVSQLHHYIRSLRNA
jgi:TetR/AcrR family transcriptional repressor of nem operon